MVISLLNPSRLLLLFSSTVILSYFSNIIYQKTRIPDLIWLLGFGVLIGPVLGYFEKSLFIQIAPFLVVLSITLINFGSGLEMDVTSLRSVLPKATILTFATFTALTLSLGWISYLLLSDISLAEGLLLGTILSGISTVAIVSIMEGLSKVIPNLESANLILSLESTLIDPIRIIIAITIIRVLIQPLQTPIDNMKDIFAILSLATFIGLLIGFLWTIILHRLRFRAYHYMVTIAVLFLVYLIGETIVGEGGGTISAFVFGLVIANHQSFTKKLGYSLRFDKNRIREFNREISFIMKSYYFVYIGLIVSFSPQFIYAGLLLTAFLIVIRYVIASIVGYILDFSSEELAITRLSYPLGTSAIVFSQLPLVYDPNQVIIRNPDIYPNIVFPVILGTIIFSSLIAPYIQLRQLRKQSARE